MPAALVTMLADYKRRWEPNDQGLLFCRNGRPASAQYFRRVLHRVRKQLGIPSGAFHAFRHGHATVMFSAGANPKVVQDAMGHANLAMTMQYTHAIAQDRRDAVERATQMGEGGRQGKENTGAAVKCPPDARLRSSRAGTSVMGRCTESI